MSACRSCGARVIWVVTERGKKMPVDAEPVRPEDHLSRGLFVLRGKGGSFTAVAAVDGTVVGDEPLYVSHFATCPNAGDWRRR